MKNFLITLFVVLMSGVAFSQTNPCEKDINLFCKDIAAKHGNIVQCLQDHNSKLSAACKKHGEDMKAVIADIKPSCQEAYQKFCTGVQTKATIAQCLKEHKKDLSDACKKEMQPEGK